MQSQLANVQSWVIKPIAVVEELNTNAKKSQQPDAAVLLKRIADGDQQALAQFYDVTCAAVFGLAVRMMADHAAAEDVVIEVYNQVWTKASTFDENRGSVMAWLLLITRSRALDLLRTRKRTPSAEGLEAAEDLPSAASGPEAETLESERRKFVLQAVAGLRPEQKQVIELAYFSGMSQSEIAAHLDLPLGTVKTRVRSGILRLRELLEPLALTCDASRVEKRI